MPIRHFLLLCSLLVIALLGAACTGAPTDGPWSLGSATDTAAGEPAEQPTEEAAPVPAAEEPAAADPPSTENTGTENGGSGSPIATLTYIEGDVLVFEPSAAVVRVGLLSQPESEPKPAQPLQPLPEGTTLELRGESSIVTFVCSNNSVHGAQGPTTVRIDPAICGGGHEVPPDSAKNKSTSTTNNGSRAVQGGAREGEADYGQIPVVVRPRNTALLAGSAPDIAWVSISGAIEYELALSSLQPFEPQIVPASDVTCTEDARVEPYPICTLPWPTDWRLEPGQRYFLTVSARTGIADPLRDSEASALRTLPAEESAAVQADADAIDAIADLDGFTRHLLLANVYETHQMYHDALLAYAAALAVQPVPQLYERQAYLYLNMELYRFALHGYAQAQTRLDAQPEPNAEVQAAIELGIGLVHYRRTKYAEAIPHMEAAIALYTELGMDEAAADATEALSATQERLP